MSKYSEISFDSLKKSIKSQFPIHLMINKKAGEYLCDRLLFFQGKQPKQRTKSVYNAQIILEQVNIIIDSWDIRSVGELLDFCKETGIHIPSWLYAGYIADLTDKGWVLFRKSNSLCSM